MNLLRGLHRRNFCWHSSLRDLFHWPSHFIWVVEEEEVRELSCVYGYDAQVLIC